MLEIELIALTKKESRVFFEKVGKHAGSELNKLKENGYLYKEIAELTGLPQNRISEVAVKGQMNSRALQLLLESKILSIERIKENCDLNAKEKVFLDENFQIFEDKTLLDEIRKIRKEGYDPVEVMREGMKHVNKVDIDAKIR